MYISNIQSIQRYHNCGLYLRIVKWNLDSTLPQVEPGLAGMLSQCLRAHQAQTATEWIHFPLTVCLHSKILFFVSIFFIFLQQKAESAVYQVSQCTTIFFTTHCIRRVGQTEIIMYEIVLIILCYHLLLVPGAAGAHSSCLGVKLESLHIFRLQVEARVPAENSHRDRKYMQTPHRRVPGRGILLL